MEFKDRLYDFSPKVIELTPHLQTEEATKNALVMPFLQLLGYDPFNPREVIPEYISDFGTKKGEKVDYAVLQDNEPIMLIECKTKNQCLDEAQCSQLYRYFTNTSARIAVLTNGLEYRFFTDLNKSNLMDSKPFMIFDVSNPEDGLIPELQKLSKAHFDLDSTISAANELKYTREIKKLIAAEFKDPSDEMVKYFASQVYSGRLTQQWRDFFKSIFRRAFTHHINDIINDRLQSAMAPNAFAQNENGQKQKETEDTESADGKQPKIVTTEEEIEGYHIIKSILREVIDPSRVAMRDKITYCGILMDDNNRKPICRFHFNTSTKYIGLFDQDKNEQKKAIETLDDIYKFADELKNTPSFYDQNT